MVRSPAGNRHEVGGWLGSDPVTAKTSVLLVEDEPLVRNTVVELLSGEGYMTSEAGSLAVARGMLRQPAPDLVLIDLQLPDGNGLDLIPEIRKSWPDTTVIVMTGHGSVENAVEAMRRGAHNFVQKPMHPDELSLILRQTMKTSRLVRRAEDQRQRESERCGFDALIAESTAMKRVVEKARIFAESPAGTVLLLGESGTGKGMVASAIHYASPRGAHPFLKVICSAIPEALLEAEMMGHERGAFTDAKSRRRGVFESADGGTVFLDEIGDMPLSLQAKLLGIIEDRSFSRVGGTSRIHVDVRLIAATHRDLDRAIERGRFREDLLYRLKVVPIVLPSLRERPEDILPMAMHFLSEFNREFGRHTEGFEKDALKFLQEHAWRGNVRELRNVIERAMLFSNAKTLSRDDLVLDTGYRPRRAAYETTPVPSGKFILPSTGIRLDEFEQDLVRQAINLADGNQSRAAALLGISRDQVRYRMEKMGLLKAKRTDG